MPEICLLCLLFYYVNLCWYLPTRLLPTAATLTVIKGFPGLHQEAPTFQSNLKAVVYLSPSQPTGSLVVMVAVGDGSPCAIGIGKKALD